MPSETIVNNKKDYLNNKYVTTELDGYWCIDFTSVGNIKAFIIIELSTRAIVGHFTKPKGDQVGEGEIVQQIIHTLDQCSSKRTLPIVLHSDNESLYNSKNLAAFLQSNQVQHSFADNIHKCHCNQVLESFNKTLKRLLRARLVERFAIPTEKKSKALNWFTKLSVLEQSQLIEEVITSYNNNPHGHLQGATPYEMEDALVLEDTSGLDTVLVEGEVLDITKEGLLDQFIEKTLSRNGTVQSKEMYVWKQEALNNYNKYWFKIAESLFHTIGRLEATQDQILASQRVAIDSIRSSKDEIITSLQSKHSSLTDKLTGQTKEIESLQVLLQNQSVKLDGQTEQISILTADIEARKKLEQELKDKREKRKGRVRKAIRDGATFPEFETAQQVINESKELDYRSEYARSRDRVANLILYLTGVRVGNLLKVTSSSLDALLYEDEFCIEETKSDKNKVIVWPLSNSAKTLAKQFEQDILVLQDGKSAADPAFTSEERKAKAMTRSWLTKRVNVILKITGKILNKKISSHSYRIGVITVITRVAGIDVACEQIGHSNIRTTYGYTRNVRSRAELETLHEKVEQEKQNRIPRHQAKAKRRAKKLEENAAA